MAPQTILSINAGSSSVKVSVYTYEERGKVPYQEAEIQVSGLTAPPASLKYNRGEHAEKKEVPGVTSQEDAFEIILKHLIGDEGLPMIASHNDVGYCCHRVVHGGDFDDAHALDQVTFRRVDELSDLAPLHNAGALALVRAVQKQVPQARNIAFFDTAFHSTIPTYISTYPIDPKVAKLHKLRKYGFHGISYAFISKSTAKFLKKPLQELNIIALHLGSGASACAIQGGKSMDTTMGLTPLAGLPGATRSGSIDPSVVFHYTNDAGTLSPESTKDMHVTQAEIILNKQSGWKALAGTTDFGVISEGKSEGAQLAFDILVDRILGYVGSYYVRLGGRVDALVFAGGIGEKGARLRKELVEKVRCLGFELDPGKNEQELEDEVVDISASGAKNKVLVCQTDEQVRENSGEQRRRC
ncbi:acetate kinase [Eremomyces bilateralis CBS 781.70]|uniref:Probable acetate kinase n=1 Tax=Eremomyces bilateralis CBS 781.70 TaxID=1392243 RepID=A0A6G1G3F4_9PEZI|nr:acetate kinase [Eremomyces bilateralis CBS 781.70]KAF1812461.1 acetate kinase [Eremomyces bilateralis CBS 781.70]